MWLWISSDSAGYLIRSRMISFQSFLRVSYRDDARRARRLPAPDPAERTCITTTCLLGPLCAHPPQSIPSTATEPLRLLDIVDNLTMYVAQKLGTHGRYSTTWFVCKRVEDTLMIDDAQPSKAGRTGIVEVQDDAIQCDEQAQTDTAVSRERCTSVPRPSLF